jgi:hypothetical protein
MHVTDNPPIEAVYENFVSWKNKRNGAIGTHLGQVVFKNFHVVDNMLAGVEVEFGIETLPDFPVLFEDILVVGESQGNSENGVKKLNPETEEWESNEYDTAGVIAPRSEGLRVKNIWFHRMNGSSMKGITTCSHCFNTCVRDSGARTSYFQGVNWDPVNINLKRVTYYNPFNAILRDEDGTLTGNSGGGWILGYFKHLEVPTACFAANLVTAEELPDTMTTDEKDAKIAAQLVLNNKWGKSIVCDNTVVARRLVFHHAEKLSLFNAMELKILRVPTEDMASYDQAYIDKALNYGMHPY